MRPSQEQQRILDVGLDSMRVRAGAGTGKTTTVAMVIAALIENHGLEPEEILGLTFTNKAAAELATRVVDFLPDALDPSRQIEVHTYHGFAAQVLAEFGPLRGLNSRFDIITPTFARQMLADIYYRRQPQVLNMTYRGTLDRIRRLADQMGDHLLDTEGILRAAEIHGGADAWDQRIEMADVLTEFQQTKRELGVVDYSDLVREGHRLLSDHPPLAALVRNRYRAVVLDEYQDTNSAQSSLLRTVFGGGFPVIAVGDEDQTIYEWRGASAENFQRFTEHFPRADGSPAHDLGLTTNRRSGPGILSVANEVRRRANPGADDLVAAEDLPTDVITHFAGDSVAEAEWIARQFEILNDSGASWRSMAVLLRKNKDFPVLIDALSSHDIPIEVANVGGLLSVPEVSHLRAWLTILTNPEDSAALLQILTGSKYRLGLADIAAITREIPRPRRDDAELVDPVTLIEAIEAGLGVNNMSKNVADRLDSFVNTHRRLLEESQVLSLVEVCRSVLDETRLWQDIEALPANSRLSAKLNIYRFLDLAEDWSPLSGRPSLPAFLEYLLAMEDEPAEELDSARLSGEDAVTLITVHRAKGLEWDTVAIPATVKNNFPSVSRGFPDPVEKGEYLPPDLRLDTTIVSLPEDQRSRRSFFRTRHFESEWRVAYVAVTRARRRLLVTGAYWYGDPKVRKTPAEPSELFEIVSQAPGAINGGMSELTPRPDSLRRHIDASDPDPLFPAGWSTTLRQAVDDPRTVSRMAEDHGLRQEVQESIDEWTSTLFALDNIPQATEPDNNRNISVTGLVTYAQCPRRYYWTAVDPLPRRPNKAAAIGTAIHRRIELDQLGQVPFEEFQPESYEVDSPDDSVSVRSGFDAYADSRFAAARADLVETPFHLQLDNGYSIRGRIDAIYREGNKWEVVDFKSGRPKDDPSLLTQLQAYAIAVSDVGFGQPAPDEVRVTFAYLGGGLNEVSYSADETWLAQARSRLDELIAGIEEENFSTTPGQWCQNCDFAQFCPAGQAYLAK